MFHTQIAAAAIALAAVIPATARADASDARADKTNDCTCPGMTEMQRADGPVFTLHRVVSVAPYYEEQTHIKSKWKELRGATVRIQAEPGLTAQWLQLQLETGVAATRLPDATMDQSPLAVTGVQPRVTSVGDGFLVTLAAPDKHAGKEVLRRTQALQAMQWQ
jgi:hypothetical protein